MPEGIPIPGKGPKPTERKVRRWQLGQREDILLPNKKYQAREDEPGTIICPTCRAISTGKRWFFDDRLYDELKDRPDVKQALCPGDERLARQQYDGEVILESERLADPAHRAEALNRIRNETVEAATEDNALHRVKLLEEGPTTLHLVTSTAFLAERIGKAFRDLWHADDRHPQGAVRVRLLKSAGRRTAGRRNQMEWPAD